MRLNEHVGMYGIVLLSSFNSFSFHAHSVSAGFGFCSTVVSINWEVLCLAFKYRCVYCSSSSVPLPPPPSNWLSFFVFVFVFVCICSLAPWFETLAASLPYFHFQGSITVYCTSSTQAQYVIEIAISSSATRTSKLSKSCTIPSA